MLVGLPQLLDQMLLVVVPAVGLLQFLLDDVLGLGNILQPRFKSKDLLILNGTLMC